MKNFIKILCIFAIVGIGISSSYAEKVSSEPFPIIYNSEQNINLNKMNNLKDIPNYEGLYAATKDGRIFSYAKPCSSKKGIFLKLQLMINKKNRITPHKQLLVGLYKDKKRKVFLVHRLIAFTYMPNPENKPDINHIDGNPLNNNVSNIEWCTKVENMKHARDTGLWDLFTEKQIRIRIENGQKTVERNRLKREQLLT